MADECIQFPILCGRRRHAFQMGDKITTTTTDLTIINVEIYRHVWCVRLQTYGPISLVLLICHSILCNVVSLHVWHWACHGNGYEERAHARTSKGTWLRADWIPLWKNNTILTNNEQYQYQSIITPYRDSIAIISVCFSLSLSRSRCGFYFAICSCWLFRVLYAGWIWI